MPLASALTRVQHVDAGVTKPFQGLLLRIFACCARRRLGSDAAQASRQPCNVARYIRNHLRGRGWSSGGSGNRSVGAVAVDGAAREYGMSSCFKVSAASCSIARERRMRMRPGMMSIVCSRPMKKLSATGKFGTAQDPETPSRYQAGALCRAS